MTLRIRVVALVGMFGLVCATPPSTAQFQTAAPGLPPPPEMSTFVVPIRASLAPLLPQLESNIPKTFKDKVVERGVDVRYEVLRDPVKLQMIGAGLHATTVAHYAVEACPSPLPCVSCGFNETKREAQIAVHSHFTWDANWRLKSQTTARAADFPRRCRITPLGLDITDRVIKPVIEQQLQDVAKTIDHNTPALSNMKPQAQQIWNSLQAPMELAPRTWLVLEPLDVSLSPITGAGLIVNSTLALTARTRIVLGDKPAVAMRPLPALKMAAPPAGNVRVAFDLEVPYAEASRIFTGELGGRSYDVEGHTLRVETLTIEPAHNGKVRLTTNIDYKGGRLRNYRGPVVLEGTPSFDAATSTLRFPDLDYSLEKKGNAFFRMAERVVHDTLRSRLRETATFPLAPRIVELRNEVTRALTRPLAPGVMLRARADAIQPVSATAMDNVIVVRVIATGAAEVEAR